MKIETRKFDPSPEERSKGKRVLAILAAAAFACVSANAIADDGKGEGGSHKLLTCDDSMKTAFKPDSLTTVLLVHAFKKGDSLVLPGGPTTPTPPTAANDVCVVKLLVGPGNPGPAGLPSTSAGIGIEVWLPSPANWNRRIHLIGGGGWAGGAQYTSLTLLAGTGGIGGPTSSPMLASTIEGAVSANTDTGHSNSANGGSFAMNPDGTINTVLWNDFAQRGIHEMVLKSKALTKAYYGKKQKYAYWDGFSTGGRQGHKFAQLHPTDFDGILAGAPAINWTRFITNELYPQIVYQRDLGGVPLTAGQLTALGNAAINACDMINGQHLGYILDPSECRYDPTHDTSALCTSSGGTNTTVNCVTAVQAEAMNKLWYGQTKDGTAPSPALDNSWSLTINGDQLWYGLTRGTTFAGLGGSNPATGAPAPFSISTDMVALEDQNPTLGTPPVNGVGGFINPTGNGANGWEKLSYAQLAGAYDNGVTLQPEFANINTDNPDLKPFRDAGGKMLLYHGLADLLIMPQGSINYYNRVVNGMGGLPAVQKFYRFFLVPGMTHGLASGSTNSTANPPLPAPVSTTTGTQQLYDVLTNWVEKGIAPTQILISAAATTTSPAESRYICLYPKKATYVSGNINAASSYVCSGGKGEGDDDHGGDDD